MNVSQYKKIFIFGGPAVGKTTFAKKLSYKTGYQLISIDEIMYKNNVKQKETKMKQSLKKKIVGNQTWIVEGSTIGWSDILFKEADLVIVIRSSRFKCLYRIVRRHLKFKEKKFSLYSTVRLCVTIMPEYNKKYIINYPIEAGARNILEVDSTSFTKLHNIFSNEEKNKAN